MTTSTTFVPAAEKLARRSGQIRLHGPEDFEGMRKAGRLTAEALDLVGPLVKPGIATAALDKFVFEFARDQLISVPFRLTGPQWRNMPNRASRHQPTRASRACAASGVWA